MGENFIAGGKYLQQELLIAILAGLGGMFGWGFADFFAKKTIDEVGSLVSLVWAHVFGTLALALIAVYQLLVLNGQISIPKDPGTWGLLLFFGTLQAVVYLLAYEGFGKGPISLLAPVFASYSGVVAIISIVVFGEPLTAVLLLALFLVFAGILFLNIDLNTDQDTDTQIARLKRFNIVGAPGLTEVLLAAALAAFWTLSWDKFIGGKDWLSYALFMYAFMTLAVFAMPKARRIKLSGVRPGLWKLLVLIGLGETVAYLAISLGFSTTPFTSIVAVLSGAFALPTIILSRVFLREKVTTIQTVGSIVTVVGIAFISLYS